MGLMGLLGLAFLSLFLVVCHCRQLFFDSAKIHKKVETAKEILKKMMATKTSYRISLSQSDGSWFSSFVGSGTIMEMRFR